MEASDEESNTIRGNTVTMLKSIRKRRETWGRRDPRVINNSSNLSMEEKAAVATASLASRRAARKSRAGNILSSGYTASSNATLPTAASRRISLHSPPLHPISALQPPTSRSPPPHRALVRETIPRPS